MVVSGQSRERTRRKGERGANSSDERDKWYSASDEFEVGRRCAPRTCAHPAAEGRPRRPSSSSIAIRSIFGLGPSDKSTGEKDEDIRCEWCDAERLRGPARRPIWQGSNQRLDGNEPVVGEGGVRSWRPESRDQPCMSRLGRGRDHHLYCRLPLRPDHPPARAGGKIPCCHGNCSRTCDRSV